MLSVSSLGGRELRGVMRGSLGLGGVGLGSFGDGSWGVGGEATGVVET